MDENLKVPAVEVADLPADVGSIDGVEPVELGQSGTDGSSSDDGDAWESESLYADALEGMGDEHLFVGEEEACTLDEAIAYRAQLRAVGEDRFIADTVEAGSITAKKLCTAFGIRPPPFLDAAPDEAFYPLLGLGISRELSKRRKLPQHNTVDDVVNLLVRSDNIIVLTGAGVGGRRWVPVSC